LGWKISQTKKKKRGEGKGGKKSSVEKPLKRKSTSLRPATTSETDDLNFLKENFAMGSMPYVRFMDYFSCETSEEKGKLRK